VDCSLPRGNTRWPRQCGVNAGGRQPDSLSAVPIPEPVCAVARTGSSGNTAPPACTYGMYCGRLLLDQLNTVPVSKLGYGQQFIPNECGSGDLHWFKIHRGSRPQAALLVGTAKKKEQMKRVTSTGSCTQWNGRRRHRAHLDRCYLESIHELLLKLAGACEGCNLCCRRCECSDISQGLFRHTGTWDLWLNLLEAGYSYAFIYTDAATCSLPFLNPPAGGLA